MVYYTQPTAYSMWSFDIFWYSFDQWWCQAARLYKDVLRSLFIEDAPGDSKNLFVRPEAGPCLQCVLLFHTFFWSELKPTAPHLVVPNHPVTHKGCWASRLPLGRFTRGNPCIWTFSHFIIYSSDPIQKMETHFAIQWFGRGGLVIHTQ